MLEPNRWFGKNVRFWVVSYIFYSDYKYIYFTFRSIARELTAAFPLNDGKIHAFAKICVKMSWKIGANFELEYLYYANISKSRAHAKTANKRKYLKTKKEKNCKCAIRHLEMEICTRKCFIRKWLWYMKPIKIFQNIHVIQNSYRGF